MIEINNLSKTFKSVKSKGILHREISYVEAVKGINMTIEEGKITGLLGINGAGKTTTVKMLSTLLKPTAGEITFDGEPYDRQMRRIKGEVNMIAGGERMIYWRLTARENLIYFGTMYGLDRVLLKERVDTLLATVGLTDKADVPVEKFSKGMKQRLHIARGMINDPRYIFLDEPTLGLDIQIAREMRNFFSDLARKQGKGILLTSHYMNEVEELCDYIYLLNEGHMILEGTPNEIIESCGGGHNLEGAILHLSKELKEVS